MSGPAVTVGAGITCMHGGPVTVAPGSPRVLLSGMPAATMADQYVVAGCLFTLPGPVAHPCVQVQWVTPALRVLVNGAPLITQGSTGLGIAADMAPQGPAVIAATQPRVIAQ